MDADKWVVSRLLFGEGRASRLLRCCRGAEGLYLLRGLSENLGSGGLMHSPMISSMMSSTRGLTDRYACTIHSRENCSVDK